jgi:hypothetical protein
MADSTIFGADFIIFNTHIKVSGRTDYYIFFDHIDKIFWWWLYMFVKVIKIFVEQDLFF